MKDKIIVFVIGVLVGAVIATGAFFIYSKSSCNSNNGQGGPGGNPPSMQNSENGQPPKMPNGENGQPPELPNNGQNNN